MINIPKKEIALFFYKAKKYIQNQEKTNPKIFNYRDWIRDFVYGNLHDPKFSLNRIICILEGQGFFKSINRNDFIILLTSIINEYLSRYKLSAGQIKETIWLDCFDCTYLHGVMVKQHVIFHNYSDE